MSSDFALQPHPPSHPPISTIVRAPTLIALRSNEAAQTPVKKSDSSNHVSATSQNPLQSAHTLEPPKTPALRPGSGQKRTASPHSSHAGGSSEILPQPARSDGVTFFATTGTNIHGAEESERILNLDDFLNLDDLIKLKAAFLGTHMNQRKRLNEDEFVSAFQYMLAKGKSTAELSLLFRKIDANSDGTVDWDEFVTYFLMENEHNIETIEEKYKTKYYVPQEFPDPNSSKYYHTTSIDRILYVRSENDVPRHEGIIRVWHCNSLKHRTSVKNFALWDDISPMPVITSWSQSIKAPPPPSYITDIIYVPSLQRIVVSSIDRSLSFYDSLSMEPLYRVRELHNSPMCLEYIDVGERGLLVFGDDDGNLQYAPFPMKGSKDKTFKRSKIHCDWINKVKYIPEIRMMITSSLDSTLSLVDLSFHVQRVFEGHEKGVYSFQWCPGIKVFASCGLDRFIRVWDTNGSRSIMVLKGHKSPIFQLAYNEADKHLISLSADKNIKIWDIRTYRCLQTIDVRSVLHTDERISAMIFDPVNDTIVIGSHKLTIFPRRRLKADQIKTHKFNVISAIYNPYFHQVVSTDEDGCVKVWDPDTGLKIFQFTTSHSAKVTSMIYDRSFRRLLTGGHDGLLKIWNYNNGLPLKEYPLVGDKDISFIFHRTENSNKYVIAVTFNQQITIWQELDEETSRNEVYKYIESKKGNVISADFRSPNYLVVGNADGDILVWNVESSFIRYTLVPPSWLPERPDECAVDQILFLNREGCMIFASSGADGMIRIWDARRGILLNEWYGMHADRESITTLATDPHSQYLFSGDAQGYIRVWDISQVDGVSENAAHIVPLSFWQGHHSYIISHIDSLDSVSKTHHLVSSSGDGMVKLWTLKGDLIGVFGQLDEWDVEDTSTFCEQQTNLLDPECGPFDHLSEHEAIPPTESPEIIESKEENDRETDLIQLMRQPASANPRKALEIYEMVEITPRIPTTSRNRSHWSRRLSDTEVDKPPEPRKENGQSIVPSINAPSAPNATPRAHLAQSHKSSRRTSVSKSAPPSSPQKPHGFSLPPLSVTTPNTPRGRSHPDGAFQQRLQTPQTPPSFPRTPRSNQPKSARATTDDRVRRAPPRFLQELHISPRYFNQSQRQMQAISAQLPDGFATKWTQLSSHLARTIATIEALPVPSPPSHPDANAQGYPNTPVSANPRAGLQRLASFAIHSARDIQATRSPANHDRTPGGSNTRPRELAPMLKTPRASFAVDPASLHAVHQEKR